jgi:hypothetical protein
MDISKVLPVICLALIIVIGVNAALFVALRRGNEAGQIELFRRAAQRAREPWKAEDEALKELSRRVAALKDSGQVGGEPENREGKDRSQERHA